MKARKLASTAAAKVRAEIRRTATVVRVAWKADVLSELTLPGLVTIVRVMKGGTNNPSLIYRIQASNRPNAAAIIAGDTRVTFSELFDQILRIASGLIARGVQPGESVMVALKNRPELMMAQSAAALLGGAAIAASPHATAAELGHLASHSRARVVIAEAELAAAVRTATKGANTRRIWVGDLPLEPGEEDFAALRDTRIDPSLREGAEGAAVVVYTSGTTGKPKGAVRKFPRETVESTLAFIGATPMRVSDVHLVAAPLYHSTAYAFATMTHLLGGAIVVSDAFSPSAFLDALAKYDVTTTALVPTMLHRILDTAQAEGRKPRSFPKLRAIFSGGAPLSGALAARAMDFFGDVLFNFYGATETGFVTLASPADLRDAPGTIGRAVPGVEIAIVDENGVPKAPGQTGELYAKSALMSAGYLRDDAATRAAKLAGFFSVGDLGRSDAAGRYFLEGRKREMIISGGVNVYPIEVEHAIEAHEAVAEAAVVGVPDDEWGERVRACVVLRPGKTIDADALKAFVKSKVAGAKVPREFVFMPQLPRNPTGKVIKSQLLG